MNKKELAAYKVAKENIKEAEQLCEDNVFATIPLQDMKTLLELIDKQEKNSQKDKEIIEALENMNLYDTTMTKKNQIKINKIYNILDRR